MLCSFEYFLVFFSVVAVPQSSHPSGADGRPAHKAGKQLSGETGYKVQLTSTHLTFSCFATMVTFGVTISCILRFWGISGKTQQKQAKSAGKRGQMPKLRVQKSVAVVAYRLGRGGSPLNLNCRPANVAGLVARLLLGSQAGAVALDQKGGAGGRGPKAVGDR